jgi:hypothetical protein
MRGEQETAESQRIYPTEHEIMEPKKPEVTIALFDRLIASIEIDSGAKPAGRHPAAAPRP